MYVRVVCTYTYIYFSRSERITINASRTFFTLLSSCQSSKLFSAAVRGVSGSGGGGGGGGSDFQFTPVRGRLTRTCRGEQASKAQAARSNPGSPTVCRCRRSTTAAT